MSAAKFLKAGLMAASAGKLDKAETLLRRCLKIEPNHIDCLVNLANVYADKGDGAQARTMYEKALACDPSNFSASANAAILASEQGRTTDAVSYYRAALRVNERFQQGYYNLANILADSRDTEAEAVVLYGKALALDPTDVDSRLNLARCLSNSGKRSEAIQHVLHAVKQHPRHAQARRTLAILQQKQGSWKEALTTALVTRQLEIAAKVRSTHETDSLLATILRASESPNKAVPFLQKAAADPTIPVAKRLIYSFRLYFLLAETGQQEMAAKVFQFLTNTTRTRMQSAVNGSGTHAQGLLDLSLLQAIEGSKEAVASAGIAAAATDSATGWMQEISSGEHGPHLCRLALYEAILPGVSLLTHKGKLAKLLGASGLQHIAPASLLVHDVAELEAGLATEPTGDFLWFLKDAGVQRAQGISIVHGNDFKTAAAQAGLREGTRLAEPLVLQKGVLDLELNKGRKFGLRVHMLFVLSPPLSPVLGSEADVNVEQKSAVEDGQRRLAVWIFHDGVVTGCAKDYTEKSSDPLVHLSNTAVQRHGGKDLKCPASEALPNWASVLDSIKHAIHKLAKASHADLATASSAWPMKHSGFQIVGSDWVIDKASKPWLLEFNAAPQFEDSFAMKDICSTIAAPLLQRMACAVASSAESDVPISVGGWQKAFG